MKICTVQFRYSGGPDYDELYRVYVESIKYHMPDIQVDTLFIDPPENTGDRSYAYKYNSVKLAKWVEYIENETDDIILTDCDMLMTGDCSHAFDVPFDIAVTRRISYPRYPYNGGVIMVRPNENSRAFFQKMLEINNRMYNDIQFHREYEKKYCGMNQAAFGWMIENYAGDIDMHEYSTAQWNAVDTDWQHVNDDTVFVHIKGSLRRKVLSREIPSGTARYVMDAWYDMAGVEKSDMIEPSHVHRGRNLITNKQKRREAMKAKKQNIRYDKRWHAIMKRITVSDSRIAEIGVYKLATAKNILAKFPDLHYLMVDPWSTDQDDSYKKSGALDSMLSQEEYDRMYHNAVQLSSDYKNASVRRLKSIEATAGVKDRTCAIVFIDGDHSYEGVKRDIAAWLPKVKPGGYICGHDYGSPRYPGVKQAVHEFFDEVEIDVDKTWFYRVGQ